MLSFAWVIRKNLASVGENYSDIYKVSSLG